MVDCKITSQNEWEYNLNLNESMREDEKTKLDFAHTISRMEIQV